MSGKSFTVALLLLMFLSLLPASTPKVRAVDAVPYDNIGIEWTRNPRLTLEDGAWDARVWEWSSTSLELYHSDASNYVRWTQDGNVDSQAQDVQGEPYMAANFDQGYEAYQNEIYDLSQRGNWSDRASSLKVEGSVTLFDGVGYGGSSQTFTLDVQDLGLYSWSHMASSLKLTQGSQVTLYSNPGYSGDRVTFVAPSYQPPDLKIVDKNSITLEGVVSNWSTDTSSSPGWTGVKFDVFAVEDRNSIASRTVMLEMYIVRGGANLAWNLYNFLQGCSGNEREGFRGPPYQSAYNYLVALDAFPELANVTVFSGNVAKWTVDVKALLQRAFDHDWGVAGAFYKLDIAKFNIVKVSFTVESARLLGPAQAGCTLKRLRLAYTDDSTVFAENAYEKPRFGSWSEVDDSSSAAGLVVKAASSASNGGFMYGPYIMEGSGALALLGEPLIASFRLKVSANTSDAQVAYLDVCYNMGTVVKYSIVRCSFFSAPNQWQEFQLPFVAPHSMAGGLEFRIVNFNSGVADLFIDRITVKKQDFAVFEENASGKPHSAASWSTFSDATSSSGTVMRALADSSNGDFLFGPYLKTDKSGAELFKMPYAVQFRMKTSANAATDYVVYLDVYCNQRVLAQRSVRASDFNSANAWQVFQLNFSVPAEVADGVEFRVENLNHGIADIYVDTIAVVKNWDSSVVYYESACDKFQLGNAWSQTADFSLESGRVMKAEASTQNGDWLFGPYFNKGWSGQPLAAEQYAAVFRLKVGSNASPAAVVYVDVVYDMGALLQSRLIRASDFASPDVWQEFQFAFSVPEDMVYGIEFRLMNLNAGVTDVYVDTVTIR
ncbi:MAG: hypothetical protein ACE14S_08150 [Candidatus Bathyarchaeia archaeon]